jgi:hypothetical protein
VTGHGTASGVLHRTGDTARMTGAAPVQGRPTPDLPGRIASASPVQTRSTEHSVCGRPSPGKPRTQALDLESSS